MINNIFFVYLPKSIYFTKKMSRSKEKITTEGLIKRLEFIHGDKYNYSLVEYSGAKNKITLIAEAGFRFFRELFLP